MATVASNFREDWKSNTLSASKWTNWGGVQCVVSDQKLRITTIALSATYYGVDSKDRIDLTGSSIFTEVIDAGNQSLASFELTLLDLQDSAANRVFWVITGGSIRAYQTVATVNTQLASTAYNSTNHRYFRIRESGGTTYWEYCSAAEMVVGAWNVLHSVANPITLTNLLIETTAGTWAATEVSATTAILGSYNVLPGSRQIIKPNLRPYPFAPCRAR